MSNAPALNFTGSQYVELSYKSTTIDAIGSKGVDNTNANQSLYRKAETINPTSVFNGNEWTSYASDYCLGLGSLAVNDMANRPNFGIYPNPVIDKIHIKGNTETMRSAKIYDLSGKLIKAVQDPFDTENSIDVRTLPQGNYILNLDGKSIKFIKK